MQRRRARVGHAIRPASDPRPFVSPASKEGAAAPDSSLPHSSNLLIARLPAVARTRLGDVGQVVDLTLSQVIAEAEAEPSCVHFPLDGFVSLLQRIDGTHVIEVNMVGREGMTGVQVALGVSREPFQCLVQGAGRALKIEAAAFRRVLAATPALRATLALYVHVLLVQQARAAACVRFHGIERRLARWLLMSQDRGRTDRLQLTQELLATTLGVRRVGVTMAAGRMQRSKLLSCERGSMTIVDRGGLELAACSCYASDRAVYAANLA